MALVAFTNHRPCRDIVLGKQRRRAMADVGVRSPLGYTGRHRQHRLLPIQRLDLRFLVHTQHDSAVGRRHVEPKDVLHLVHKERIG
jgi:hypothetical protein